jgi:hypothetical protein
MIGRGRAEGGRGGRAKATFGIETRRQRNVGGLWLMLDPIARTVASVEGLETACGSVLFHDWADDDNDEASQDRRQILGGGDPNERSNAAQPGPGECAVCGGALC